MDIGRYWKTIFDTLRDGMIVVDIQGMIVAVNPAAETITGYPAEELVGRTCRILNCTGCKFYGDGRGEKWCRMFSVGKTKDKQCRITRKDRRAVHILKSACVLRDPEGEIIGAVETLTDISRIIHQEREIASLRQAFYLDDGYHGILGKTLRMQGLFELIENVAQSDAPVMISGESGTGKEMVARAVHDAGSRKEKPFIKVNGAALNENLLESELFGHVRGAFTGADRTRIGRFEAAHEGTIFLDEIGDIPQSTQVKLLRVLEEKMIEKVGDHTPVPVNVRIITATNRNIEEMVREGRFREDLYFRINVFPVHCPRLTDRIEDIPLLVQHFIRQNAKGTGKEILEVTPEALEKLVAYSWPGNIRELRNTIEYAFVLCPGGSIDVAHLPGKICGGATCRPEQPAGLLAGKAVERDQLVRTLEQCGWNQSEAARILRVSRVTIWKRMTRYRLKKPA